MKAEWTRFNQYLYKYWKLQTAVIALGLISVPLGLLNPYLTKLVIDKAYGNKDLKLFLVLAIIGGSAFIVNGLINSVSDYLSKRINRQVNFDLAGDLFRHLQGLSLNFFDNHSTGEHLYKIHAEVNSASNFVCSAIPQLVTLVPRLLFTVVIVFYLDWKLALFTTLLVPVTYIHPYHFAKWLKEIMQKSILKAQDMFKVLQETFSHIHLIKALGKEKYEIARFESALTKKIEFDIENARVSNISAFLSSILNKALGGGIALYGGYQVINGRITLGSLTAIMIYLTQFTGLLKSLGAFYQNAIVNSVICQRLRETLDITPDIYDSPEAMVYNFEQGKIELKEVFFGYNNNDFVLQGVSLAIEPAAKVGLVGPSGCGKSTLVSLLLRLYQQQKGAVLIDGVDIRKIKLDCLKSQTAVALQEPLLWNDTIANNIAYGAEAATEQEVVQCAMLAEAHDFIQHFPQQYDSVIGEAACKISEGQKQRIALARALIKRPKILILDEAMSSVDSQTESKIVDNLKQQFRDSTIIVVSHRLSTISRMDLVYFLERPDHIAVGPHQKLTESNPKYRALFSGQK